MMAGNRNAFRFKPSAEMTALVLRGASALGLSEWRSRLPFGVSLLDEIALEVAASLHDALVSELRSRRAIGEVRIAIFDDSNFWTEFLQGYLPQLPLLDGDESEFSKLLTTEFAAYVRNGGAMEGRWGNLALRDGQAIVQLSALDRVSFVPRAPKAMDIDL